MVTETSDGFSIDIDSLTWSFRITQKQYSNRGHAEDMNKGEQ